MVQKKQTPVVTEDELAEIIGMFESKTASKSGFVFVEDEVVDTSRSWFDDWRKVVETSDGRFLALRYEVGKTAYQEGDEREPTVDDVVEVFPHAVVTIEYSAERPAVHDGVYGHTGKIE